MKTPKQGSSICEPKATTTPPPHNSSPEITSVSDGLGDVTTFAYDSDGNLIPESYPNHVAAAYAYNLADQPTTIADTEAGTTIASFGYARNADSLIATAAETTPTAPVSSPTAETTTAANNAYSYTPNDQLASANANPYTYDPAGNLTAAPGGAAISYDAADEATSLTKPATGGGTTTTTYGYSPLGERTSQTTGSVTTTLGYNQAGQLTSYGTAATYTYNGDGLRMTKAVTTPAGGVITSNFIWDTVTRVPLVLYDTTNTYIYGPAGRPVEQINAATPLFLHQDQLGSTRLLTDLTGGIVAAYNYTPYGKPTAATGSATTPLGFAGQYTDAETGLIYMRARYYDPTTAQFITVDPAFTTTLAPYSYANNNPINMVDPLGLCSWYNLYCEAVQPAAHFVWRGHLPLPPASRLPAHSQLTRLSLTGQPGWGLDPPATQRVGPEELAGVATWGGIAAGASASALTAANGGYEIANGEYTSGSIDLALGLLGFGGTGADVTAALNDSKLVENIGRGIDIGGGGLGFLACEFGL